MIGYLGPSGTFSEIAAKEYLGERVDQLKEFSSIYSLIKAVETGDIESAVVPIENSIEGSVNVTLDALAFDVNLYIVDEYVLRIKQNFLVKKGSKKEDIKVIMSHPQAIGQCSRMIEREFANAKIVYANSTAQAGETAASSDGEVAVIASLNCAKINNLEVMHEDCGDENNNSTRFVILKKNQNMRVTSTDKSSIVFTLDDKPGNLYRALSLFEKSNINLIKIESRPLKKELGKYIFFIDIDGNIDNPTIYFALDAVKKNTSFYKFLGSYPKAR